MPPPDGGGGAPALATHTVGTLVWVPADGGAAWAKGDVVRVLPGGRLAVRLEDGGDEVDLEAASCPVQNPAARLGVEVRAGGGERGIASRAIARQGGGGEARHTLAPRPRSRRECRPTGRVRDQRLAEGQEACTDGRRLHFFTR